MVTASARQHSTIWSMYHLWSQPCVSPFPYLVNVPSLSGHLSPFPYLVNVSSLSAHRHSVRLDSASGDTNSDEVTARVDLLSTTKPISHSCLSTARTSTSVGKMRKWDVNAFPIRPMIGLGDLEGLEMEFCFDCSLQSTLGSGLAQMGLFMVRLASLL